MASYQSPYSGVTVTIVEVTDLTPSPSPTEEIEATGTLSPNSSEICDLGMVHFTSLEIATSTSPIPKDVNDAQDLKEVKDVQEANDLNNL